MAIASAMSCWQLTAAIPAACAAWSSGWSGSTDVSAFETAIRSTTGRPCPSTTCETSWPQAIGMPVAVTAAL